MSGFHFNRKHPTHYRGILSVSGVKCICKADYYKGKVVGNLSSSRSNKQQPFEIEPISVRKEPNMLMEL